MFEICSKVWYTVGNQNKSHPPKEVPTMDQLNSKEALVLRYITDRINDGVPPTVREICSELSIKSTSTAHKYLRSLDRKSVV